MFNKPTGDDLIIKKCVLSKKICDDLIYISNNEYDLDLYVDPVDNFPVYESDIFLHDIIYKPKLFKICQDIMNKYMKDIKKRCYFIFLRRYKPNERPGVCLHNDDCSVSVSFALSSKNDFEGGDLYMFDRKTSKKLKPILQSPTRDREAFVQDHIKYLPIVDYDFGDMLIFKGCDCFHGVLPLTHGERYTLNFFFA